MSDRFTEIVPVQLRGIGARSLAAEDRRAVPVRIRTRGRLERTLDIRNPRMLADLIAALRRDADGLPLTAALIWSGGGTNQTEFFRQLAKLFTDPLDALWIVAASEATAARTAVGGAAIVLDLDNEQDRSICANLVVDLLFTGGDDSGVAEIVKFQRRTPFVIVPENSPALQAYSLQAAAAGIPVLTWSEGSRRVSSPMPDLSCPAADSAAPAKWLAQLAAHLSPRSDRRIQFRNALRDVAATTGDQVVRDLIRQVHAERWPEWAIETLPTRFLPLETIDGSVHGLIWNLLTQCVAVPIAPRERFCGGVLFEIDIEEGAAAMLTELDREIETIVSASPAGGDGPFYVGVAMALDAFAARDPATVHAAKMRDVSGRLERRRG